MQPNQDPTQRFMVSAIANVLRALLTPLYYAIRNDMGVQYSGLLPVAQSALFYGGIGTLIARTSEINVKGFELFAALVMAGFIRNAGQAKYRRRFRDWSVQSWSTGRSLLEPVFVICCRLVYRKWGGNPRVRRFLSYLLTSDFIYYVAEPTVLVMSAGALYSIGASLFLYPLLLAVALIVVRNDRKLYMYLKAHEIADGQMFERAIRSEFEGPVAQATGIPVVQIPMAPASRPATDKKSVFKRLSPELQMLLMRDFDAQQ